MWKQMNFFKQAYVGLKTLYILALSLDGSAMDMDMRLAFLLMPVLYEKNCKFC